MGIAFTSSDIHLADPLDILLANDIPVTQWGRKAKINIQSSITTRPKLARYNWQKTHIDSQVSKSSSKIVMSKTFPVCPIYNKSGFEWKTDTSVRLCKVLCSKTKGRIPHWWLTRPAGL